MSKKHFVALAAALFAQRPDLADAIALNQWERDVHAIAEACARTNQAFRFDLFLTACGVVR